jgi:hypothetical protein
MPAIMYRVSFVRAGILIRNLAVVAFMGFFTGPTFLSAGTPERLTWRDPLAEGNDLRAWATSVWSPASQGEALAISALPDSRLTFADAGSVVKRQATSNWLSTQPVGQVKPGSVADAVPAVHLANIATRLAVGTGDNVLIAGFIITGSQPKKVLLRGLGPSVPVNENLADPTLELHDSSNAIVAASDSWRETQQAELQATTIPPSNDYEPAIVKSLTPGNYTAVLAGKGGTTGTGVVEVYDLDLAADSRLANISTRGLVDQGDNVLIGGTIVVGSGSTTVLFRALGPSLPGIPNSLKDPTLELHNGQGGIVATNDNWQDTQKDAIQQTTIPPPDPREAAILQQLTPGGYTVIVRGKDNTTGIAVVEAYQLN